MLMEMLIVTKKLKDGSSQRTGVTMTKPDGKELEVFEKIFGPKRNNYDYEIRSNKDLEELCNEPGNVGNLEKRARPRGRPRQRRADTIKEDPEILGVKNAQETAKDREDRRRYVVAAMGLKEPVKSQRRRRRITRDITANSV
ncbi:Hypothetical protein CINCED_3A010459 [Cinara cedri]|uniref:Uncharacterized protein n=1 Tax=Cinara cedri TaxID=506608 RepID=A0A5E4NAE5_9HEMI|nr:Hypothetical protein CINCED_3A010459 [Cinara cedri]